MFKKEEVTTLFINAVNDLVGSLKVRNRKEIVDKLEWDTTSMSSVMNGKRNVPSEIADKFFKDYNIANYTSRSHSNAKVISTDDFMEVKYLPVRGRAGYLSAYAQVDGEADEELDSLLVPKEYEKGNYLVIEADGDSMDDGTSRAICDGDKLLAKELDKSLWADYKLHFKRYLFVIFTKSEGIVIKQICEHDLQKGIIECHSWNVMYNNFTIKTSDILRLLYVKKIVERKIKF